MGGEKQSPENDPGRNPVPGAARNDVSGTSDTVAICPSPDELAQLLGDVPHSAEHERLVDHVGLCPDCQHALLALAGDDSDWPSWEAVLRTGCISWPTRVDSGSPAASAPERWHLVPGFEILDVLGAGGMGVVYKARHLALNRLVALKVMRAGWQRDGEFQRRFRGEAEALARLQHPNLVQIFDVLEFEGCPLLVLEYVDGGSLSDRLRSENLAPREAAAMLMTAAHAIHSAHEQGIVHRDLKPANILLQDHPRQTGDSTMRMGGEQQSTRAIQTKEANRDEGESRSSLFRPSHIKISDFGLARCLDAESATRTGDLMGTPSYMAPEQARGEADWSSPAADVYSLGAVLYEGLTGRPPFRAESTYATIMQVIREEPLPPSRLNREIPSDLETICLKCLAKEPAARYPSAEALADDLQRFLDGLPIRARRRAWWVHVGKWVSRQPMLAATSAVAAIAVVALLIAWMTFTIDLRKLNQELTGKNELAAIKQEEAERARNRSLELLVDVSDIVLAHVQLVETESELDLPPLQPLRQRLIVQTLDSYEELLTQMEVPWLANHRSVGYQQLAVLLKNDGEHQRAAEIMEQAIRTRAEYRRVISGDAATDSSLAVMLVDYAAILTETDRLEDAESAVHQAISILERPRLSPQLSRCDRLYRLAVARMQLGRVLKKQPDEAEAAEAALVAAGTTIRAALTDEEGLQEVNEPLHEYMAMGGTVQRDLGMHLRAAGKLAEAHEAFRFALQFSGRACELLPDKTMYSSQLAASHCHVAAVLAKLDQVNDAREHFREALAIREELVDMLPHIPHHRFELAAIQWTLANMARDAGDPDAARDLYNRAAGHQIMLVRQRPTNAKDAQMLCTTLLDWGRIVEGDEEALSQRLTEGLDALEPWTSPDSPAAPAITRLRELADRL